MSIPVYTLTEDFIKDYDDLLNNTNLSSTEKDAEKRWLVKKLIEDVKTAMTPEMILSVTQHKSVSPKDEDDKEKHEQA
jgi:hypothetical protein